METGAITNTGEAGQFPALYGSRVVFGRANWPPSIDLEETRPDLLLTHDETSALAAGDFNGDGRDDLVFSRVLEEGVVFLLLGREAFPPRLNPWSEADAVIIGKQERWPRCTALDLPGDALGFALAAGDLNGDGFDDLVVRLTGPEAIGVFWGRRAWPEVIDLAEEQPDLTIGGVPAMWADAASDFSKAKLGDVDGDGQLDLIVNVPLPSAPIEPGRPFTPFGPVAFVLFGPLSEDVTDLAESADVTVEGRDFTPDFLAVGDVTGDGRDDLLLGDSNEEQGYLLYGREAWPARWNLEESPPDLVLTARALFQSCLTFTSCGQPEPLAIGDLNDDGLGDLLLAAPWAHPPQVFVRYGRADFER